MIVLPQLIWDTLLDELRWPRRPVERVAYIDGVRCGDMQVATTLTFPNAEMHPHYFTVSGEAMSEAGKHFRRFGMERLAQVHTHPGWDASHSPFDDENAYCQFDGSLSIVVPQHGRYRPALADCGVHIREPKGWRRLDTQDVENAISIVPGCLDFRRYQWPG